MAKTQIGTREVQAEKALAFFELKSTLNGRFLHYCMQRSGQGQFLSRQLFIIWICGTLAVLEDLTLGLGIFLLVTATDILDCIWLRHVWSRWRRMVVPRRIYWVAVGTAAVQSAANTVAAIYALQVPQTATVAQEASLEIFGITTFFAIVLNAGIIFPYAPVIAKIKLFITGAGGLAILVFYLWAGNDAIGWLHAHAYILSAAVILGFVAYNFIKMVTDSFDRNQTARQALLRNQVALAEATAASKEREQQAMRLALIAENTSESIFVTDTQNRIFWTNAAFSLTTGFSPQEAIGRTPGEVLDATGTDPASIQAINHLRDHGLKGRVEILNRFKDGSLHWISSSLNPVFDDAGKVTMCISVERDITDEKMRIRELAEAHEQGQAAARAKEGFFATMSHEIRTPMNGVLGMADLLSRTPLNEEQHSYLATIKESGDALLGIINDILDLSKLQSEKVQVVDAPFDLADVVMGVTTLLRPLARQKGISLLIATEDRGPNWVMGDSGRVRQILINLVGNAVKFTAQGGVTVSLLKDAAGHPEIRVQDTGIGISADRLEAVFDSFTQADSAINRQYGGTGLGLTICRMLARAMGGDVQAASVEGQGSVFTLSLPLPPADAQHVDHGPAFAQVTQPAPAHQKHILIAEDNGTNRLILRKMLEADHVTLTEVVNGADAVAAYCVKAPDLVVMDMQMPIMDGLTAIRHIREDERLRGLPRCPILMLSANAFPEDTKASFAAGCDEFMTKPVLHGALLACTSRLLGEGVAEQALPAPRMLA